MNNQTTFYQLAQQLDRDLDANYGEAVDVYDVVNGVRLTLNRDRVALNEERESVHLSLALLIAAACSVRYY